MIVGGARSLHNQRALGRIIPDPVIRDEAKSPLRTVYRPVAETSKEWRARLEAEDELLKQKDERERQEHAQLQLKAGEILREQIKEATESKKTVKAVEHQTEVHASVRAQTRLLRDQEEQRHEREKRALELQVTRMKDKIEFDRLNEIGQQAVSARQRDERRRKSSLRQHVEYEEQEKAKKKMLSKREEDQLRQRELMAQNQETRLRIKAEKMEERLRQQEDERNQEHWSSLEQQHIARRKKAAMDTTRRQEDVAKLLYAEQMEKQQSILQDRVERRPDPFTDQPGPASPNTKRQNGNQYRGMLAQQISVRNALADADKNKEKERFAASVSGPNSSRRLQHALW